MFKKYLGPFFDAATDTGGGLTVDNIFETLSSDKSDDKVIDDKSDDLKDDSKDDKDEKSEKSDEIDLNEEDKEDEEDDDESSDDENEDEEKIDLDEETEDEIELAKIPTRAQIKAKYPNIFKEFKALDHIFHREKAYAEIFTTVKDAKDAKGSLEEYSNLQGELLSGNIVGVLSRVKESNPKAYKKIADGIIDSLIKVEPESYKEPAVAVIKGTLFNINNVAAQALKRNPENKQAQQLQIAAEMIHEQLFGTDEISSYAKTEAKEDKLSPEEEKFQRERQEFDNTKFSNAHDKVTRRFDDAVSSAINKYVDTRGNLTEYIKGKVTADVKSELDRQLVNDKAFGGIVKKLYQRAKESNYSDESVNNIVVALKHKAGSILLPIIRAKRGEALKGSSSNKPKARELSRESKGSDATTRSSSNRSSETRSSKGKEKDEGPRPGESAFEYLQRTLD